MFLECSYISSGQSMRCFPPAGTSCVSQKPSLSCLLLHLLICWHQPCFRHGCIAAAGVCVSPVRSAVATYLPLCDRPLFLGYAAGMAPAHRANARCTLWPVWACSYQTLFCPQPQYNLEYNLVKDEYLMSDKKVFQVTLQSSRGNLYFIKMFHTLDKKIII